MFLVNSRLGLFSAAPDSYGRRGPTPSRAPLLPKLRGQFAEFLNHSSLDRLSVLHSPTCVGLGYGRARNSLRSFSWEHGFSHFAYKARPSPQPCSGARIFLVPGLRQGPWSTSATVGLPFSVPPSLERCVRGAGMSTCCPSPTTLVLGLGPD